MTTGPTTTRFRDLGLLREWELFDAIDEGFCVIQVIFDGERAVDYRFVEINASFERQTGLSGALGRTMRELSPTHAEHWFEIYGRVARTGESVRFDQGAENLGGRWYNVFAFRVGHPELNLVAILFRDEADRHRVEMALHESQQRLEAALSTARMASWTWDPASDRLVASASMAEVFGLPPGKSIPSGDQGLAAIHPDHRAAHQQLVARALERGEGWHAEFRVVRPVDGQEAWLEERASVSNDPHTGAIRWTGLVWDVTERKRVEETLRDADRRKDEFIATLAHELRNPLAPICNIVELLRRQPSLGPAVEQLRGILERQVRHMTRLVEDLLEVSRITSGKLELRRDRLLLQSVLTAAVETAQPHAQHEFSMFIPPEPLLLHADPVRLAQVFANLLNNARKFTPAGGRISIGAQRHGDGVKVVVRDEGIGIAPADLHRIFEPFVQVSRDSLPSQGLGIGLSLAHSLVKMHGGTIEAHSAGAGRGTEFVVLLPLDEETRPAASTGTEAAAGEAFHQDLLGTVLVVDDKPDNVSTLAMLLDLPDHRVHTAADGEEAVRRAEMLRPDVILMDIGLPGMDGYQACAAIRAQPWSRRAVILAITGWGQEEDRRRSLEAGFDEHLVKPVDSAALLRAVERARSAGRA